MLALMLEAGIDESAEARARARVERGEATWQDHHLLGVLRYRAGAFEEAFEHAARARALGGRGATTTYLAGLVQRELGKLAEAAGSFEEAAREARDAALRGRAFYGLGTVRCLQGDARGALEPLARSVELVPDLAEAWHNLGVAAVRAGVWPEVERAFAHLARSDPARRDAYLPLLYDVGRAAGLDEMRTQGHRIKNLVSVLGDDARRLTSELEQAEDPAAAHVGRIAQGIEGVFTAMHRYLAAMREQPLELDLIDVNDLVARCFFAASASLEGLTVERRLSPGLPEVLGDRAELEEVLLNVVLNAVEAIKEGPRRDVAAPDILVVTGALDAARVAIAVEDRGPGVEPSRREHVFLLGYTTKPRGSGIGLTQVRKIVRAHGGDVIALSAGHGGARFEIVLPVRPPNETRLPLLSLRSPLQEGLADLDLREPGRDAVGLAP